METCLKSHWLELCEGSDRKQTLQAMEYYTTFKEKEEEVTY